MTTDTSITEPPVPDQLAEPPQGSVVAVAHTVWLRHANDSLGAVWTRMGDECVYGWADVLRWCGRTDHVDLLRRGWSS